MMVMRLMVFVMGLLLGQSQVLAGTAVANLADANGKAVGSVLIRDVSNGVLLSGSFLGLGGKVQAVHVHAVGLCEGPGFTTAGGHWNPAMREHGLHNPKGAHRGDMPNLRPDPKGRAVLTGFIGGGGLVEMLDADGASVMIHADADDNLSDPAGNAGDRVACGVVTRTGQP
jgi:superoxide dismutase, Cu-Zn family